MVTCLPQIPTNTKDTLLNPDTRISDQKTPRSTVPSHTDPVSPRFPDRCGHLRRYTLSEVAWVPDGRPTSGTANDDVALQHASRTRSPLPRKGRERSFAISNLVYIRPVTTKDLQTFNYVGSVEQIASRRGCGVNGGLTVTIFLACMRRSRKGISTMQSRHRTCGNHLSVRFAWGVSYMRFFLGGGEGGEEEGGQRDYPRFLVLLEALSNEMNGIESRSRPKRIPPAPAF